MENLNLVELLRDCPTGMELDSTVFDNITFDYVNTEQNRIYCKIDNRDTIWFTAKGCINLAPSAKCVIFPKGKTTWEGFHRPFKDGDILVIGDTVYIYNGIEELSPFPSHYVYAIADKNGLFEINTSTKRYGTRFATEEEKQRLFDAIKANGYHWNAETKTLEKLPKFKMGDRIEKCGYRFTIAEVKDDYYLTECGNKIPIDNQDDFSLVPNKFDITTLKPFDKVLVRDFDNTPWEIEFFSRLFDGKHFKCLDVSYTQCIPYEGNEHLLGTTNDCDPFFKTWENNN